jgi:hypothetical protein
MEAQLREQQAAVPAPSSRSSTSDRRELEHRRCRNEAERSGAGAPCLAAAAKRLQQRASDRAARGRECRVASRLSRKASSAPRRCRMVQRVGGDRPERSPETAGSRGCRAGSRAAVVGFSNPRGLCDSLHGNEQSARRFCPGGDAEARAEPTAAGPAPSPRPERPSGKRARRRLRPWRSESAGCFV